MEKFELVLNEAMGKGKFDIGFLDVNTGAKVQGFHSSFNVYEKTPLTYLDALAKELGVKSIAVKDESYRFGLNAFKVLGGSYAIGNYIAQSIGEDITNLSAQKMLSKEVKDRVGELTFVTATDGNHGRGVAWTANRLGQKSVVYMPKGSSQERLDNIKAEGADASITDMNYDEAVRLANSKADSEGYIMVQDTAWEGYVDIPTWIMQGYMTMGYEIMLQLEEMKKEKPTHIFLQAGVGSMAGAVCGFFRNLYKDEKDAPIITVVEPEKANCVFKTAKANDGKIHFVTGDMDTIMAGLACGEPCTIGWDILRDYANAFISCPDYTAADGMRMLAAPIGEDKKIVSGESGAAGIGCVANIITKPELAHMKNALKIDENSVLMFISTEGDTDKNAYKDIVWGGKHSNY